MRALLLRAFFGGAVVVLFVGAGVLGASPASAHTLSGPEPTNFRTRIVSIEPPAPGVSLRVVDLGAELELTNRTSADVVVLGYEGEPYLRIGPDGVFENTHSGATYLNESLQGGVIPEGVAVGADVAPEWRKVSGAQHYRWHDHRAHWMQSGRPPQVAAAPDAFHALSTGHVRFVHDGTTSDAMIALDWVPGPSGIAWLPVGIAAFALAFAAAVSVRGLRVVAVLVGLLVVLDVSHTIAYELVRPGTNLAKTGQFLANGFVSVLVWIAAVPTIIALWRRRAEALYGAIFVALMIALVGGASDLSVLWHSQLPSAGPDVLTRLEVVLALAIGGGITLGALTRVVFVERSRARDSRGAPREARAPNWLSTLVVGLSDDDLLRISADLDVDEVLESALGDLATRMRPRREELHAGALVWQVVAHDDSGPHTWSLFTGADGPAETTVLAQRGVHEPVRTEVRISFPLLLQLLAGTVSIDDALRTNRLTVQGDPSLLHTALLRAVAPR
jgi:hypothetical protein